MAAIGVFQPARFEALYGVISAVVSASATQGAAGEWYMAVEREREALGSLGQVRGPSEAERREINAGKIVLDGATQSLNADFVAQTLLLADELQVSEYYAASLLQEGIAAVGRWGRAPTEVACLLHYRERLALLACLKELARGAYTLSLSDDSTLLRAGGRMCRLLEALAGSRTATLERFPERILARIEELRAERTRVHAALQGSARPAGAPKLGDEVQLERLTWAAQEAQELAQVLYLLALARRLAPRAVLALLRTVAAAPAERVPAASVLVLAALLAALDTVPDASAELLAEQTAGALCTTRSLQEDRGFVQSAQQELQRPWPNEGLRGVVGLQWALFLTDTLQQTPAASAQLGVSYEQAMALGGAAITGGDLGAALRGAETDGEPARPPAFVYLLMHLLAFRHRDLDLFAGEEGAAGAEPLDAEAQEFVLQQVLHLLHSTTTALLPLLRKLQRAEEDAAFASVRTGRPGVALPVRRYDIEALFDLVALVCHGRPEAGLALWLGAGAERRAPPRFLLWAVDVREPGQQRALLHMLAALATGEQCAGHAHALLEFDAGAAGGERRLISWGRLFDWLAHYVELFRSAAGAGAAMPPEEMVLLRAFCGVLATVVRYSAAARDALYFNGAYAPVAQLFGLYLCPVPVDLKAALLEALGAFAARPPHAARSARILEDLWQRLANSGVLSAAPRSLGGGGASGSVVWELEHVEAAHFRYPGSTAFVRFLQQVLPASTAGTRAEALLTGVQHAAPGGVLRVPGIPAAMGAAAAAAGAPPTAPYVAFVVDRVFLPASRRVYADPEERWRVSATCLAFLDHCLASLDMRALFADDSTPDAPVLEQLARHPGFEVLKRLLAGTPVLRELLAFLHPDPGAAGFEAVNAQGARPTPFTEAVRSALRIVLRVLQLQDTFLAVLLPALSEAGGALRAAAGSRAAYMPLDMHLLHAHGVVVQVALFVNCVQDDIALLALRTLALLAQSRTFRATDRFGGTLHRQSMNRLVGVLVMTDEAERVKAGVLGWLEALRGMSGDVEALAAAAATLGEPEADEEGAAAATAPGDATAAIARALLDLLLENTQRTSEAPNIAHLLLGFDLRAARDEDQLVDADARGRPASVLGALVALLRPPSGGAAATADAEVHHGAALAEAAPALAERGYALLHQLCVHPYTSAATLRYLRTRGEFVLRQVVYAPLRVPPSPGVALPHAALGRVVYPGGEAVVATAEALLAYLRTLGSTLALAALELHALALHGQLPKALPLVGALLGAQATTGELEGAQELLLPPARAAASGAHLTALLHALDFAWLDEREEAAAEAISITSPAALAPALAEAADETRVYDLHAVAQVLLHEREQARARGGELPADAWLAQAALVLRWAAAQNTRRALGAARRGAMQAWRQVLDVLLTQALGVVRPEARAQVLLDALGALLPRLSDARRGAEAEGAPLDLVAGAVLSLLSALRTHAAEAQQDVAGVLPTDRLLTVLRALLDGILRLGTGAETRGDLYSALVVYLQLVQQRSADAAPDALAARTHALLASQLDRLGEVLSRDALDAADVWKTVAFTTLDKLAAFDAAHAAGGAGTALATLLASRGYLRSFALLLRDLDAPLQEALAPDPRSLNAQYVYEALLAFLCRVARTPAGGALLLDARVLEVYARVDFPSLRPDTAGEAALDADGFLPPAAERYTALLTPMLQLLLALLARGGRVRRAEGAPPAGSAPAQALVLLAAHRDALLAVLAAPLHASGATLGSLEPATLLVHVLGLLTPLLPDGGAPGVEPGAAGVLPALHTGVLSLAAAYLGGSAPVLVPSTPAEREEAAVLAPSAGGLLHPADGARRESLFDAACAAASNKLLLAAAQYLEQASGGRPGAVRVSLAPALGHHAPRTEAGAPLARSAAFSMGAGVTPLALRSGGGSGGAAPSVGVVAAALDAQLDALGAQMRLLERVHGVLHDPAAVRMEEWDEIARDALGSDAVGLDAPPAYSKQVALRELRARQASLKAQTGAKLDTVELFLVVLVRHVAFYLRHGAGGAGANAAAYARDAGAVLLPVLEDKLAFLELSPSLLPDAKERTAFLQMAARRLSHLLLEHE